MPKESLVKIIPKPKPKIPGSVNFLFWFSLILLIFLGGTFFLLQRQISPLKEKSEELEGEMAKTGTQAQKAQEKELSNISEKIKDFSDLFKEHKITSTLFDFLKSSCHPRVQFTSLNLNKDFSVNLGAKTENFQTLGEQFLVFKENKNVGGLQLSNVFMDREGKVKFNLTFTLSSNFFKK